MRPNQKLYVVTRRDLSPGSQAVQGMHALVDFMMYHPDKGQQWWKDSSYLCFLSVENEEELNILAGKLFRADVAHSLFREPDLSMSLTAIAIEATDQASVLVANLRLALK